MHCRNCPRKDCLWLRTCWLDRQCGFVLGLERGCIMHHLATMYWQNSYLYFNNKIYLKRALLSIFSGSSLNSFCVVNFSLLILLLFFSKVGQVNFFFLERHAKTSTHLSNNCSRTTNTASDPYVSFHINSINVSQYKKDIIFQTEINQKDWRSSWLFILYFLAIRLFNSFPSQWSAEHFASPLHPF